VSLIFLLIYVFPIGPNQTKPNIIRVNRTEPDRTKLNWTRSNQTESDQTKS